MIGTTKDGKKTHGLPRSPSPIVGNWRPTAGNRIEQLSRFRAQVVTASRKAKVTLPKISGFKDET